MLKKLLMLCLALALSIGAAFAAVDVNTADQTSLEAVKGLGPVKSKAIIDERTKNGPFKDADDLASRVKGLGAKSVTISVSFSRSRGSTRLNSLRRSRRRGGTKSTPTISRPVVIASAWCSPTEDRASASSSCSPATRRRSIWSSALFERLRATAMECIQASKLVSWAPSSIPTREGSRSAAPSQVSARPRNPASRCSPARRELTARAPSAH